MSADSENTQNQTPVHRARIMCVATVEIFFENLHLDVVTRMRAEGALVVGVGRNVAESVRCQRAFSHVHSLPFSRNPLAPTQLIKAGVELRFLAEKYGINLIHVQTPIAGFLTRYAFRHSKYRQRIAIVYTAHGFHFYRGGPWIRNSIYRVCERFAAHYTDVICTVNKEDYEAALQFNTVPGGHIAQVPGTGVDCARFDRRAVSAEQIQILKDSIGIGSGVKMVLMVAEFIPRKRHVDALRALAMMGRTPVTLVMIGRGRGLESTKVEARKLGVYERCRFLGHRMDVPQLLASADVLWLPSRQEGLPTCIMEALAMECPVIASDIRGTRDLLAGGCGRLHEVGSFRDLAIATNEMLEQTAESHESAQRGRAKICDQYSTERVVEALIKIYSKALAGLLQKQDANRRNAV